MASICIPEWNVPARVLNAANVLKKVVNAEIKALKAEGIKPDIGDIVATLRGEVLAGENGERMAAIIDEAIEFAYPAAEGQVSRAVNSYHINIEDLDFKPIRLKTITGEGFLNKAEETSESDGDDENSEYGQDFVGTTNQKIGDAGMDAFDVNFNMVVGKRITDSDSKLNASNAKKFTDFDEYKEWVADYFALEESYDITLNVYNDTSQLDDLGNEREVWLVKELSEARQQLSAIKKGKGKGADYSNDISVYGDHWIIRHAKGEHKHIYIKGSEPLTLDKSTKKKKGSLYSKSLDATQLANLLTYWNTHNEKNSMPFDKRMHYIWTNLDPNAEMETFDDIVDAIVVSDKNKPGPKRIIKRTNVRLNNQVKESSVIPKTYLDNLKRKMRELPVSAYTGYHAMSQSGTLRKRNDGGFWMESDQGSFTLRDLLRFEYDLSQVTKGGNNVPMVPIGLTPGDNGTLITTHIHPSMMNELFDPNYVLELMQELQFPQKIIDDFNERDVSVLTFLENLKKDQQEFTKSQRIKDVDAEPISSRVKIAGQIRSMQNKALHSKLFNQALSNLQEYFDKQVKAKNMTQEDADIIMADARNWKESIAKTNAGEKRVPYTVHLPGIIAKYEWLQAVRGDDFMMYKDRKGDNAFNVFDRLKIALSKGISLSNIPPRRTFIINNKKDKNGNSPIEYWLNGEKLSHEHTTDKLTFIENLFDGASMSGTENLDLIANKTGTQKIKSTDHNLREIKTTEYHSGPEGMFEKKHALFAAIPGLEIRKASKTGQGEIIVTVKEEGGEIRIKDKNGQIVHQVSDMDATKSATGVYNIKENARDPFVEAELSMDDFKVIINPHASSPKTTYGAVQYLSNLNFDVNEMQAEDAKSFNKYQKAFEDILGGQSDFYIELLLEATENPRVLWDIIKHSFSDKAEAKNALRSILNTTDGYGVYHPNNLAMIKPMISNMLIRRGFMQGRTSDQGLIKNIKNKKLKEKLQKMATYGSHYIMKPWRQVNKGSVILSAENTVIFNKVKDNYANDKKGFSDIINDLPKERQVEILNTYIADNPQYVLSYRSPIGQSAAVEPRMIQEFTIDDGNAIYHHPDDTFDRLVGDYDIDETGVTLLTNKQAKDIMEFQNTDLYKQFRSLNADISIFARAKSPHIGSVVESRAAILANLNAHFVQGQAVNMKSIASALSTKFEEIELSSGLKLRPKKLFSNKKSEKVVMDYAPLKEDFNTNALPPGARVVGLNPQTKKYEDYEPSFGDMFLETSAEHEFLLIMNAAVDVGKDGMLINKWGANKENWFIDRMFKFNRPTDKITKLEYRAIRELINKPFSNSRLRKMRTIKTNRVMDMNLMFYLLSQKRKMLNLNAEDLKNQLINQSPVSWSEKTGPDAQTDKKAEIDISSVRTVLDSKIEALESKSSLTAAEKKELNKLKNATFETLEEKFTVRAFDKFQEKFQVADGSMIEAPLLFNKDRQDTAHEFARQAILKDIESLTDMGLISAKEIKEGAKLAQRFSDRFYETLADMAEANEDVNDDGNEALKEEHIKRRQVEFDEELYDLTLEYNSEINKLQAKFGDGIRHVFTANMIYGINDKKNIRYLPPVELMSPDLVKSYFTNWESSFLDDVKMAQEYLDQSQFPIDKLLGRVVKENIENEDC